LFTVLTESFADFHITADLGGQAVQIVLLFAHLCTYTTVIR